MPASSPRVSDFDNFFFACIDNALDEPVVCGPPLPGHLPPSSVPLHCLNLWPPPALSSPLSTPSQVTTGTGISRDTSPRD